MSCLKIFKFYFIHSMDPEIQRLHIIADCMKATAADHASDLAEKGLDITWSVNIRQEELDVYEIIEVRCQNTGKLWFHHEFIVDNINLAQFVGHYWKWLSDYFKV